MPVLSRLTFCPELGPTSSLRSSYFLPSSRTHRPMFSDGLTPAIHTSERGKSRVQSRQLLLHAIHVPFSTASILKTRLALVEAPSRQDCNRALLCLTPL